MLQTYATLKTVTPVRLRHQLIGTGHPNSEAAVVSTQAPLNHLPECVYPVKRQVVAGNKIKNASCSLSKYQEFINIPSDSYPTTCCK